MTTTYESGAIQNGTLRYNIQVRQLQDGSWQQRHIYLAGSSVGTFVHTEDHVEEWIPTPRGIGESCRTRYQAVR